MHRICIANWLARPAGWMLSAVAAFTLIAACDNSETVSPSTETPSAEVPTVAPADSTIGIIDSTLQPDTVGLAQSGAFGPGIPFGLMDLRAQYHNSLYRASKQGLLPEWTMAELQTAKAKGGRFILKMASKEDERIQNADGTFSMAKWKALVYAFKKLNLNPYITDGTLWGHFLVDEPENARKWGGKPISHAAVEEMARYSKQLWPGLTTIVRAPPTWVAKSTMNFTYLDGAWAQYGAFKGPVGTWIAAEVSAAKRKNLGLVMSLNVLDGGNGSSGIRGWLSYRWRMTAAEIRTYGSTMLAQRYACGFLHWMHLEPGKTYFARTDINSAVVYLSNIAKNHPQVPCRF